MVFWMNSLASDPKAQYFVYMLLCVNDAYYTGYTTDLERRYQEHCNSSAKCKYTRSFPPVRIAASWSFTEAQAARSAEAKIKRLSRGEKIVLIRSPQTLYAAMEKSNKIELRVVSSVGRAVDS